ncbi:PIN domain-containing protein [Phenylobacterium aquaticum]|uniref:PIN domain-containing protein n=1 Tax=Phenylobacterium aquaticum TaxID=1763816 RepID=UPI0026EBF70D|nr:PIN domain-containing protein [Phenylobacterium aquaticum]
MILGLDTRVVMALLSGAEPHYRRRLDEARALGAQACLSSIVLNELALAALKGPRADQDLMRIDALVGEIEVEAWTAEDALAAARLRMELERDGQGIGAFDTLVAGQALSRGWTLVTTDAWAFLRVKGLALLDWSDPAGARDYSEAALARRMKAALVSGDR